MTVPKSKTKKTVVTRAKKPANKNYYFPLLAIVLISFACYIPVFSNGFVNLDDNVYIQENPLIRSIDLSAIFSQYQQGNYHPLTMLIYAIQYKFFGLDAAGYHVVALLFHLLNVVFVVFVVLKLSGRQSVGLVAGLLFGIHPLHVESVAWASELKDLLYSFFFLAAWFCYLIYSENLKKKFYWISLVLFLLSLFSKGMAVSLPVVLLLSDYLKRRKFSTALWLEKIPFFILSIVFGVIAIMAQRSGGAIQDFDVYPLPQRIVFACYDLVMYMFKLVIPSHLSAFYPYPMQTGNNIPGSYYLYPVILILIIGLIIYSGKFSRKIFFGMAFFVVTVFLVLQLLPVGGALMADRYVYIASIGVFYLIAEGMNWIWNNKPSLKYPVAILFSISVIFYAVKTYQRSGIWKNGMELWNNVIAEEPTVALAYNNRGALFMEKNQLKEAFDDFNKAIAIRPKYAEALVNRAVVFVNMGKYDDAMNDYNKAIQLRPDVAKAFNNRGMLFANLGKTDEALRDYNRAIELQPGFAVAYNNRGNLFLNQGKYEEAGRDYNKAIQLNPADVLACNGLGVLQMRQKNFGAAIATFTNAININPNYAEAFCNRAIARHESGDNPSACADLQQSIRLGFSQAKQLSDQWCK